MDDHELSRLKEWLHRQRSGVRLGREQAEGKKRKEEETAKGKTDQPALSQF